jgi:hypothetical protein
MAKISEHLEQKALIQWFRMQYPKYAKCLWAIPNGGARHIRTAVTLKQEGVLSGVSDLFLMIPRGLNHGLFIEMKAKDGRLSDAQKEFIGMAQMMGYKAEVCYGFEQAKKIVTTYLHL